MHRKYNYNNFWFRPKKWEKKVYEFLKVKQWKGKMISYDSTQFSLLFAIPFGAFAAFLSKAIVAAAIDLMFVVMQRYNRPRLVKIVERLS